MQNFLLQPPFLENGSRCPSQKKKIAPFIEKYQIDSSEFQEEVESFPSFNAFFIRKLKKESRPLAHGAIMPADGRYLFYQNIETCSGFIVKGKKFSLVELLKNEVLAKKYYEGSMIIARLCPSDYHRFHFPFDCLPGSPQCINGPLFPVNPIALKRNILYLTENKRVITLLKSSRYGDVSFLEIGATNVGSIHQTFTPNKSCKKGEEKGFFSFGGSALILLFEKGRIIFAKDLLTNSSQQFETFCHFGDSLED